MSLPSRLLGANPSIQVSTLLSGSLTTPSAKQAFAEGDYQSIATATVGTGGTAYVEFTSIPQTFKHLQLRCIGRSNRTSYFLEYGKLTFNSDTGSNYAIHHFHSDGSSTYIYAVASNSEAQIGRFAGAASPAIANSFGASIVDILDYTNTNQATTVQSLGGSEHNGAGGEINFYNSLWTNTAAITTIRITVGGGSLWSEYSKFALYGIGRA